MYFLIFFSYQVRFCKCSTVCNNYLYNSKNLNNMYVKVIMYVLVDIVFIHYSIITNLYLNKHDRQCDKYERLNH